MTAAYTFTAAGKPKPKGRPRMTRRGRVFTPMDTLRAQDLLADQYDGPFYDGPVHVMIEYHNDHQVVTIKPMPRSYKGTAKLRGDLDNMIKLTLDALNNSAWQDDKIVKAITAKVV